jgi:adenylate kinase family enzyme
MGDQKRRLILIAGIPGTGKTTLGEFARHHGFVHLGLEDPCLFKHLLHDSSKFIDDMLDKNVGDVVVTWGFVPSDVGTGIVKEFIAKGFKLVWFDGNRDAAFRAYIDRATYLFNLQVGRIGDSTFIDPLKPVRVNSFDENGKFKPPAVILEEIEKG